MNENSNIIVFKTKKNKNYETISLECTKDSRISWKAKGIHTYLITRPDYWHIHIKDLINRSPDGKTSLYSGLAELSEFGYIFRMIKRNDKKQIISGGYFTSDVPMERKDAANSIKEFGWEINTKGITCDLLVDQEPETRPPGDQPIRKENTNSNLIREFSSSLNSPTNVVELKRKKENSLDSQLGCQSQIPNFPIISKENPSLSKQSKTTTPIMENVPPPKEIPRIIRIDFPCRPIKSRPPDPFKPFTKQAKVLFNHWNSLGKPIPKIKTNSKSFKKGLESLDKLMNKSFTVDEIKSSMDNYKHILTMNSSKLCRPTEKPYAIGSVVSLCDFCKMPEWIKPLIEKSNKMIKDVDSWFMECMNTREYLEAKWSRFIKDEYPKITDKLKDLWDEFGGRELKNNADDENTFRRIAKKAYNYFDSITDDYNWGLGQDPVIARIHYIFDAFEAEGYDFRMLKPHFLLADNVYSEKLPMHFDRISLYKAETEEGLSFAEEELARRRKVTEEFNSHFDLTIPKETRAELQARIRAQNEAMESNINIDYALYD